VYIVVHRSGYNMKFLSFVMFIAAIDGLNNSLINKTENIAFSFAVNENTRLSGLNFLSYYIIILLICYLCNLCFVAYASMELLFIALWRDYQNSSQHTKNYHQFEIWHCEIFQCQCVILTRHYWENRINGRGN